MGDDHAVTLEELKLLMTTLVNDISIIKADQSHIHVALNKVQSDVLGSASSSSSKDKGIAGPNGNSDTPMASHKLRFPKHEAASTPSPGTTVTNSFVWHARKRKRRSGMPPSTSTATHNNGTSA
jgi:hypothetical protein